MSFESYEFQNKKKNQTFPFLKIIRKDILEKCSKENSIHLYTLLLYTDGTPTNILQRRIPEMCVEEDFFGKIRQ